MESVNLNEVPFLLVWFSKDNHHNRLTVLHAVVSSLYVLLYGQGGHDPARLSVFRLLPRGTHT